MRILIETEEPKTYGRLDSPSVPSAMSAPQAAADDAGTAPTDFQYPADDSSKSALATNAGTPPDWLVQAIESASATHAVSSSSNGEAIDGGGGL